MIWEISGLPLHPLVVHVVVVLVPLVAIGGVVIAFVPGWRVTYGVPLVGLAVVAAGSALLAKESGEHLEEQVKETVQLEKHAELGDTFPLFAVLLLFAVAALVGLQLWLDWSGSQATPPRAKRALAVLAVVTVVAACLATLQVVRVGDSGARATWSDVGATSG